MPRGNGVKSMSTNLGAMGPALLALSLLAPQAGLAQEGIKDNSFLIEEAYNQGPGVVQHINAFSRVAGEGSWIYTFTQEWPFKAQRHQLSFTLPVQSLHSTAGNETGLGDIALNYRYQAIGMEPGPLAFSPRLTVLVPTGKSKAGLGAGGLALQANLPLSLEVGSRFVTHWNAGLTRTFSAKDSVGREADTQSYSLGQSVVWLAGPKVNFLVETVWSRAQAVVGAGRVENEDSAFISPGIRWAHDFKNGLQIVPGIAFPIGIGPSRGEHAVFVYLSFEHPFKRTP
jgi:hypothetical protein